MTTFDFKKVDAKNQVLVLPTILVETNESFSKAKKTTTIYVGFAKWVVSLDIIRPLKLKETKA